jgi:hypothetical protein
VPLGAVVVPGVVVVPEVVSLGAVVLPGIVALGAVVVPEVVPPEPELVWAELGRANGKVVKLKANVPAKTILGKSEGFISNGSSYFLNSCGFFLFKNGIVKFVNC